MPGAEVRSSPQRRAAVWGSERDKQRDSPLRSHHHHAWNTAIASPRRTSPGDRGGEMPPLRFTTPTPVVSPSSPVSVGASGSRRALYTAVLRCRQGLLEPAWEAIGEAERGLDSDVRVLYWKGRIAWLRQDFAVATEHLRMAQEVLAATGQMVCTDAIAGFTHTELEEMLLTLQRVERRRRDREGAGSAHAARIVPPRFELRRILNAIASVIWHFVDSTRRRLQQGCWLLVQWLFAVVMGSVGVVWEVVVKCSAHRPTWAAFLVRRHQLPLRSFQRSVLPFVVVGFVCFVLGTITGAQFGCGPPLPRGLPRVHHPLCAAQSAPGGGGEVAGDGAGGASSGCVSHSATALADTTTWLYVGGHFPSATSSRSGNAAPTPQRNDGLPAEPIAVEREEDEPLETWTAWPFPLHRSFPSVSDVWDSIHGWVHKARDRFESVSLVS